MIFPSYGREVRNTKKLLSSILYMVWVTSKLMAVHLQLGNVAYSFSMPSVILLWPHQRPSEAVLHQITRVNEAPGFTDWVVKFL